MLTNRKRATGASWLAYIRDVTIDNRILCCAEDNERSEEH